MALTQSLDDFVATVGGHKSLADDEATPTSNQNSGMTATAVAASSASLFGFESGRSFPSTTPCRMCGSVDC